MEEKKTDLKPSKPSTAQKKRSTTTSAAKTKTAAAKPAAAPKKKPASKPAVKKEKTLAAEPIVTPAPAPLEDVAPEVGKPESLPVVQEEAAPVEVRPEDAPRDIPVVDPNPTPADKNAKKVVWKELNTAVDPLTAPQQLEKKRKVFYSSFMKYRIVSFVLMGVGIALLISMFVLLLLNIAEKYGYVIYIILGVTIAVLVSNLIYSKLTNRKQSASLQGYVEDFITDTVSACYLGTELEEVRVGPNANIQDAEVISAHLFSVINRINSRARVEGQLHGHSFASADVAIIIPTQTPTAEKSKNKETFGIYGRYFSYDLGLSNKMGVIIVRRSAKTIMPNHLIGYQEVKVESLSNEFVVYATSEELIEKLFKAEIVDLLNSLAITQYLFDYIISLNEHGSFAALNYSDAIMALPMNKPLVEAAYSELRDDTHKILDFFSLLK